MTIKKRITGSSIVLLVLFMAMGGVYWLGNFSVKDKTSTAYLLEKATMHVQGIFRGINEFIIDEGEPLSIELTREHVKAFDEIYRTLAETITDPGIKPIISDKLRPQWADVKEGVENFIKNNPYISVDDDKAMMEYGALTTKARTLHKDVEALAAKTKEIAESTARKTNNTVNAVLVLILTIISFLLLSLYRSIITPIRELNLLAEGFSSGNLGMVMNDSRKDEFGTLASHFNKATEKLNGMISSIQLAGETISSNSRRLSSSATLIADNAREQSDQTTQSVTAIEQISTSFVDVAKNTAAAADSSKEASDLAFKSSDIINSTVKSMKIISEAARESSESVEDLDNGSRQIEEVINVIHDIASQTNLLALNAAIEAARAGEQGRGFAVVADEVRKLSEKTTASTGEIGEVIKGIQENTDRTVTSLQSWIKEVNSGLELADQAGNAMQMIVASINNVTDMVQHVAAAAEEQSTSANMLSSNINAVAELTEQTAKNAMESSEATDSFNKLSLELEHLISSFKLRDENMIQ